MTSPSCPNQGISIVHSEDLQTLGMETIADLAARPQADLFTVPLFWPRKAGRAMR
jgi:hypothetical protein